MSDAKTIAVAMSGGVDSSVAAALSVESGAEVFGVHLLLPRFGPDGKPVDSGGSRDDVARVCSELGVGLHTVDFREAFEEAVLEDFCRSYAEGRTPNPCVVCNERVKFGAMLNAAREAGADFLATGHYARKAEADGRHALLRGPTGGDQSYFLYRLTQEQLEHALFPVGGFRKTQVRQMARERRLPVHDKPDSQDLCFLPDGAYRRLLRERCPKAFAPGPIILATGGVVGRHAGIAAYTIGQRRGLGVSHSEPLYVVGFDRRNNAVIVGERERLLSECISAVDLNWVSVAPPLEPLKAEVQIRYSHGGSSALLQPHGTEAVSIRFDEPQEAATPGQAAVFRRGDALLGGGTIHEVAGQETAA